MLGEGLHVLWKLFALGPGGRKFPLDYELPAHSQVGIEPLQNFFKSCLKFLHSVLAFPWLSTVRVP